MTPEGGVVLDAGAFIALEQRNRTMVVLTQRLIQAKTPLVTSAGVVAQVWRGGANSQVPISYLLKRTTVVDLTPQEALAFATAYVLSIAIGVLAIFAPSGLGVREATIVLILSQFIPAAQAIVIALLARLISTASDALVAILYAGFRRAVPKEFRP